MTKQTDLFFKYFFFCDSGTFSSFVLILPLHNEMTRNIYIFIYAHNGGDSKQESREVEREGERKRAREKDSEREGGGKNNAVAEVLHPQHTPNAPFFFLPFFFSFLLYPS